MLERFRRMVGALLEFKWGWRLCEFWVTGVGLLGAFMED